MYFIVTETKIKLYVHPVFRHGNWSVILRLEGIQQRVTKLIKIVKDYNFRQRLEKLRLMSLLERRMRGGQIETFKIIEFLVIVDIFCNISLCTEHFQSR